MSQEKRRELSVRCQVLLSAAPATVSEEAAWEYVREMVAEIRAGRESFDNLQVVEGVAELWRLKHQRERGVKAMFRRIRREAQEKRARFSAFAKNVKAERAAESVILESGFRARRSA